MPNINTDLDDAFEKESERLDEDVDIDGAVEAVEELYKSIEAVIAAAECENRARSMKVSRFKTSVEDLVSKMKSGILPSMSVDGKKIEEAVEEHLYEELDHLMAAPDRRLMIEELRRLQNKLLAYSEAEIPENMAKHYCVKHDSDELEGVKDEVLQEGTQVLDEAELEDEECVLLSEAIQD